VRAGYFAYLRYVMPLVVGAASSNPEAYRYLFDSIKDWPDQTTLSQWLRGAGFTRVAHRNLTTGVVALHRGRKPLNAAIRASVAQRRAGDATPAKRRPARAPFSPPSSPPSSSAQ
jgi:demethylmenaquinone methyltransferase/2-methoxy-6-polyprenyl-1,4-benzoquinol methylase